LNYNTNYIIFTFLFILSNFCNLKAESFFELKLPFQNSKINEIDAYQNKIIVVGVINENSSDVFIGVLDTLTKEFKLRNYSTQEREIEPHIQILNNQIKFTFWKLNYIDNQIEIYFDLNLQEQKFKHLSIQSDCEFWGSNSKNNLSAYVGLIGGGNAPLLLYGNNINNQQVFTSLGNGYFNWGYDCNFDSLNNLNIIGHTQFNDYNFLIIKLDSTYSKIIVLF
jgi:hypothetical protein